MRNRSGLMRSKRWPQRLERGNRGFQKRGRQGGLRLSRFGKYLIRSAKEEICPPSAERRPRITLSAGDGPRFTFLNYCKSFCFSRRWHIPKRYRAALATAVQIRHRSAMFIENING